VQDLGRRRQPVEIVPLVLEQADRPGRLVLELDPLEIVDLEFEQLVERALGIPVGQLRIIQQHDAGGAIGRQLLDAGAHAAHQGLALHVACEQVPDVADCEAVRIDHDRPAVIVHQLGRHEAQRGEGLQVVDLPDPALNVAQERLALLGVEPGKILAVQDHDLEPVGVPAVPTQRVRCDQRTQILLVIGLDEDLVLHAFLALRRPPTLAALRIRDNRNQQQSAPAGCAVLPQIS
jgi:hypothetical protein